MIIQLKGTQATNFKRFLDTRKSQTGKMPKAAERTEAYFAAINDRKPWWI